MWVGVSVSVSVSACKYVNVLYREPYTERSIAWGVAGSTVESNQREQQLSRTRGLVTKWLVPTYFKKLLDDDSSPLRRVANNYDIQLYIAAVLFSTYSISITTLKINPASGSVNIVVHSIQTYLVGGLWSATEYTLYRLRLTTGLRAEYKVGIY